jgi:hypothetical protein
MRSGTGGPEWVVGGGGGEGGGAGATGTHTNN